jgi:protein-S-isoprenylcysteine O-methyltransferase Ste14
MVTISGTGTIEFYLWISIILIWFLSEFVGATIIPYLRRHGAKIKKENRGSRLFIYMSMYSSLTIAIYLALRGIASLPFIFIYPGLILMVLGIILRQWAIAILGRFFTVDVGTQKEQRVVSNGPYRLIRHPSYSGILLILIGFGLSLQSWGSVLIVILINGLTIGYRIHVEERVLVSELGEEYMQYMKRTKRLIPYIL